MTVPQQRRRISFAAIKEYGEFVFAAALAIYGVLGYYVIHKQWEVMRQQTAVMQQQSRVMRDQLIDARKAAAESDVAAERQFRIAKAQADATSALVEAYRRQLVVAEAQAGAATRQAGSASQQAKAAESAAAAMADQAKAMKTLADANEQIASAAKVSAEAAVRAARISGEQLELTDRPWLTAAAIPERLEFVALEESYEIEPRDRMIDGVMLRLKVDIKNDGRVVASHIRAATRLVFIGSRDNFWPDDVEKVAQEMCSAVVEFELPGKALFSGERAFKYADLIEQIPSQKTYPPAPGGRVGTTVQLGIVGCVTYTYVTATKDHHTWFAYKLGQRNSSDLAPFLTWSFDIHRETSPQALFFEKMPYGGNGAD